MIPSKPAETCSKTNLSYTKIRLKSISSTKNHNSTNCDQKSTFIDLKLTTIDQKLTLIDLELTLTDQKWKLMKNQPKVAQKST